MGVCGLTTYISENSRLYLKPHELCDCYLVVDGSNIVFHLYKWVSKSHSAFGGDYDEYCRTVKSFFTMLKICNVTPIVLFDGGHEKRKVSTTLARIRGTLPLLKTFARGFSGAKVYPLFMRETFLDVMEEMKITCVQCDLEADVEIASVARALNCPVLSYDSDFFIFDVLYVPLSSVHVKPVRYDNSNRYYVRCSIYNVDDFLNTFGGLDKTVLPVVATLLGNDYIKRETFEKFFHQISLPKSKCKSYSQRKVDGVLQWLKEETFESAVKQILCHTESIKAGKVVAAINTSVKDYTETNVSESVMEKLRTRLGDLGLKEKPCIFTLPPEIKRLYCRCRINKFISDVITLRTYFTPLQVGCVHKESPHCISMQLIADIYTILSPYLLGSSRPLYLYLGLENQYVGVRLKETVSDDLKNVTLNDILKEPEEKRLKWLCTILELNDNDLEIVPKSDWSIFILSFIYWIRKLNSSISLSHIHALILMAMANKIIQKDVGYFETYARFMKSKGHVLNKLKGENIVIGDGKNFTEMLDNVTLYEKLLIQSNLLPFRQSTEKGMGRSYCISTIHLYASFQSCLFHIMQINALLNYPLPHLKISDFYSGTLLFNFYLSIKAKTSVEKFGCSLFKDAPNLLTVYTYLWESLCEYSEKTSVVLESSSKKKKNRKKKRSKKTEETCEAGNFEVLSNVCSENDEDGEGDDYNDENNPYALLRCGIQC